MLIGFAFNDSKWLAPQAQLRLHLPDASHSDRQYPKFNVNHSAAVNFPIKAL